MFKSKRYPVFVLSGIALIYGVVIGYFFYKSVDSRTWVQVNAVVVKSDLIVHDMGKELMFIPTRYPYRYEPVITYEYTVDGQSYQTQQVLIGGNREFTRKDSATRFMAQYSSGRHINAFYNPRKPEEATLRPGETDVLIFLINLTLVLVCLGVFWNLLRLLWMLVGLPAKIWQYYLDIKSGKAFEIVDEVDEESAE